jgi:tetratricopeptide (TPR) repeat protein
MGVCCFAQIKSFCTCFTKTVGLSFVVHFLESRPLIMQAMNRPQEAITSYLQAIRLRPDFAIAHGNLASIYYEQGQLEQAIATYRNAILLEPTFVEAYNNLVSSCANLFRSNLQ